MKQAENKNSCDRHDDSIIAELPANLCFDGTMCQLVIEDFYDDKSQVFLHSVRYQSLEPDAEDLISATGRTIAEAVTAIKKSEIFKTQMKGE